ncbi:MAG: phosphoribosyl-AMP cyclohydrolase [Thiobacillaceae bacterium]|nr:phosphoribosyl-AMP cyclohydrolase [Thiobacillaceae bacterium]MCX7673149.1 phosphoribosyl-AMP cyclohydrolase [Thiobacillaceae bacterium]MDW8322894.1 phosphoribosyl-AMP cyclohydrolase [Burkholderiales bacterium]
MDFPARGSVMEIEEGRRLMPLFDERGLIPVVVQDHASGEVLMLGWMNRDALALTIQTGWAHYWSRSRQRLWRKGEQSGQAQRVRRILIDDDQDCLLLAVELTGGASCHVGYRSCFFRELHWSPGATDFGLVYLEQSKVYDPAVAYGQGSQTAVKEAEA